MGIDPEHYHDIFQRFIICVGHRKVIRITAARRHHRTASVYAKPVRICPYQLGNLGFAGQSHILTGTRLALQDISDICYSILIQIPTVKRRILFRRNGSVVPVDLPRLPRTAAEDT